MKPPNLGTLKVVFNNAMMLGADSGPQPDFLTLVQFLRHCFPEVAQLYVCDAYRLMKERRLVAAREVMEEAAQRFPADQMVRAMLALVLYWLQEPTWQATFDEACAMPPDPDAAEVIASIERLQEANLAGRRYQGKAAEADDKPAGNAGESLAPLMFAMRC